jgi:hypothetical protein
LKLFAQKEIPLMIKAFADIDSGCRQAGQHDRVIQLSLPGLCFMRTPPVKKCVLKKEIR